jgi:hypothetical protein
MFDFVKDFSVDGKGVIGPSGILIELPHFISDVYVMIHRPLALDRIVRVESQMPKTEYLSRYKTRDVLVWQ